jgi:hypothetical protein
MTGSHFRHALAMALSLQAALMLSTASAQAQARPQGIDTRVRVATVATLPIRSAAAMIVRTEGQIPLVVLDGTHRDPETLGMALALVQKVRRVPIAAGQQQIIPIQGGVARSGTSPVRLGFLRRQLQRLAARPVGRIGALGSGQFIEFSDELPRTVSFSTAN